MSDSCKKVIETFYAGTISRMELYHRILEAWEPHANVLEIVEMLKPEEAEGFKRMVEGWLFEGGITVFGGVTRFRKINGAWCHIEPSEPMESSGPVVAIPALRAFKQYYGFDVPEKFRK